MGFLSNSYLEEKESVEKLGRDKDGIIYTFFFLHASNVYKQCLQRSPTLVPPSQQRLHKSTVSAETGLSAALLGLG